MLKKAILDYYNILFLGHILLPIAPYLCLISYIPFISVTIYQLKSKELSKIQIVLAFFFIVFSLWMLFRTQSPWGWGIHSIHHPFLYPVTVIDYLLFLWVLYLLMLKPFNRAGIEKLAWSLALSTFPLLALAVAERFLKIKGFFFSFPANKLPIIKFQIGGTVITRTEAGFGNSNMLGYYCVLLILLSLGIFILEVIRVKQKGLKEAKIHLFKIAILSISIGLDLFILKWAGSKNAIICLIFLLGLFALLIGSRLLLFLAGLGVTLVGAAIFSNGTLGSWVQSVVFSNLSIQNNISPRVEMFGCAIDLIKEKPLNGWGISTMAIECEHRVRFMNHAHNIILQLASEMGIPFTILFCAVIIYIMVLALRNVKVNYQKDTAKYLLIAFWVAFFGSMLMSFLSLVIIHSYRLIIISCFCLAIPYAGLESHQQVINESDYSGVQLDETHSQRLT